MAHMGGRCHCGCTGRSGTYSGPPTPPIERDPHRQHESTGTKLGRNSAAGGNSWSTQVVARLQLPREVGAEFTYKGKRGASRWTVVAANDDGSIIARKLT
jgi:hypothetical protein